MPNKAKEANFEGVAMTPFWKTLVLLTLSIEIIRTFGLPGEALTQAQGLINPVRAYPMSRLETDATADPTAMFILGGENAMLTNDFMNNYTRGSGSTVNGLNMIVADYAYIPGARNLLARTLHLADINDSPDVDLGRAPGEYPNNPDYTRLLDPNTIMGNFAFRAWTGRRGFGAQVAGMQAVVAQDQRLALLILSTATGRAGRTPDRSREYKADELVPHVALWPSGTFDIGYGTDPDQRPRWAAKIHGSILASGAVYAQKCIELPASTIEAEMKQ